MHAAALGQIGPIKTKSQDDDDVDVASTRPESVEIGTLREDLASQTWRVLQERHLSANPIRAYMRNLQCTEVFSDNPNLNGGRPSTSSFDSIKAKDGNPYARLAYQFMPILSWLPSIRWQTVRADVVAGLTVGVMVIPQSMSYANIAGLEYIYGMYSACVPTIVYGFFGQSRQLAVGPVAMVSLLVEAGLNGQLTESQARTPECRAWFDGPQDTEQYKGCKDEYAELAFLASLAVGVMQVAASLLRLGFIVSFLGHPVTSGFTSGAAIIIALSQLKYILGFDITKSQYVTVTIEQVFKKIKHTKPMTMVLGLVWLTFLIVNKKASQRFQRLKWLGPLGPLISCVVGILLIWLCDPLREDYDISYVGEIPDGLMPVSVQSWNFGSLPGVMPTAATACLIGYMESVAIGKSLAAKHGYEIDAGQELFALGVANIVGGCFSCYPVTGSFSRSAVMNSTGGLSQLGGIVSAIVMFCTLMFLTPLFYYLPKFALAAIVMNSVIPLVAFSEAKKLYRIKKHDFILWVVAFLGTMLLGVLYGIALAVILSLCIVIYESVRPQITILWRIPGTAIYRNVKQESSGVFIPNVFICRIGSSMYFANASFIKDMILAYINDLEYVTITEYIVLEMTAVVSADSTAVHVIQDFVSDFQSRGIYVAFAMVGNRLEKTLRKAGLKRDIGEQWFFPTVNEAVQYCLRHQQAKKASFRRSISQPKENVDSTNEIQEQEGKENKVVQGNDTVNEIGFSNDMNPESTVILISLSEDFPMIMSEITSVFRAHQVAIVRAQVEPQGDGGAKHTYFVKSIKRDSKLTEYETERLQDDLETLIKTYSRRRNKGEKSGLSMDGRQVSPQLVLLGGRSTPEEIAGADLIAPAIKGKAASEYSACSSSRTRLRHLEDKLAVEQSTSYEIQEQLRKQRCALEALVAASRSPTKESNHASDSGNGLEALVRPGMQNLSNPAAPNSVLVSLNDPHLPTEGVGRSAL